MARFKESVEAFVGESIALVIGYIVCISILVGWYAIGQWAAPYLGWTGNKDVFGILSALTFLWIYEHRNIEHKYDRLQELRDREVPGSST